jgi:hypothetical protein
MIEKKYIIFSIHIQTIIILYSCVYAISVPSLNIVRKKFFCKDTFAFIFFLCVQTKQIVN